MNILLWLLIIIFAIPVFLYTLAYSMGSIMFILNYICKGKLIKEDTYKELIKHLRANINGMIISYCILGSLILIKLW